MKTFKRFVQSHDNTAGILVGFKMCVILSQTAMIEMLFGCSTSVESVLLSVVHANIVGWLSSGLSS